ncbi:LacI family DNA-binding transcriptional regulator [Microbacterium sp. A93]|uniref:LacI family DNA-binding transcriptional regulator n=1 Tax=Microbacterium sp. A93 TaxID=3450716 RepID=UPI003F42446B
MPTPHRVTIYDVARLSRVSPATVSRSLSQPDKVHPQTLEHVLGVVERLGYRRGASARSAGARHSGTIAMVVPDIANPYYSEAIRGAEKRTQSAGVGLLLVNTEEDPVREQANIERLIGRVDGFVLTSSRLPDEAIRSLSTRTRVVLLNRHIPGISCALVDQDQGSRHIIAHLTALGHTRVAYAGGPSSSWARHQRWAALSDHAQANGVEIRQLGPFRPSMEDGPTAAEEVLRAGATAVVAHNDLLAIGIIQHLQGNDLAVPADLSVVGYDDMFVSRFCTPPLTTLGGQYEAAAHHGVEMLVEGRRNQLMVLPSSLAIRDSTGPAPAPRW